MKQEMLAYVSDVFSGEMAYVSDVYSYSALRL
jgi:hypothetical protein